MAEATPAKPCRWYVAIYNGGLDVRHYNDPLAYGRAVRAAEREYDNSDGCGGECSWTHGTIDPE